MEFAESPNRTRQAIPLDQISEIVASEFRTPSIRLIGLSELWTGFRTLGRSETVEIRSRLHDTTLPVRSETLELIHGDYTDMASPAIAVIQSSTGPLPDAFGGASIVLEPTRRNELGSRGQRWPLTFKLDGHQHTAPALTLEDDFVATFAYNRAYYTLHGRRWTDPLEFDFLDSIDAYILGWERLQERYLG